MKTIMKNLALVRGYDRREPYMSPIIMSTLVENVAVPDQNLLRQYQLKATLGVGFTLSFPSSHADLAAATKRAQRQINEMLVGELRTMVYVLEGAVANRDFTTAQKIIGDMKDFMEVDL